MRGVIGSTKPTWNFQVAHDKVLTPQLLALAVGSALEMTASEQRMSITWAMTSKLRVRGYPEITLEDFGVTDGGMSPRLLFRTTVIAAATTSVAPNSKVGLCGLFSARARANARPHTPPANPANETMAAVDLDTRLFTMSASVGLTAWFDLRPLGPATRQCQPFAGNTKQRCRGR